jgi:hypothetical protein
MIATTQIANELVARLRNEIKDRSFRPRVWTGGTKVRVYTGNRGEYLQINEDLSIEPSRPRIAWGDIFREMGLYR